MPSCMHISMVALCVARYMYAVYVYLSPVCGHDRLTGYTYRYARYTLKCII